MRSMVAILVVLCVAFLFASRAEANDVEDTSEAASPEQQAIASALLWLELVDNGEYQASWEAAAEYFKQAVTAEQLEQSLNAVRTPLGNVTAREETSATYATELPGAPDGEYVVIQFATSFENKKSAVETVTPMKEEDGSWKVSGYFIR